MNNWEHTRANWVNGNRKDAKEDFMRSKKSILENTFNAVASHLESLPNGVTRSGDLIDLLELIRYSLATEK